MSFLPLAPVTSAVAAPYFVVAALCGHVLSRGCFGFCALAVGTQVLGRATFMGCVACALFQHRRLTPQSSGLPRWCASPLTFDVRAARQRLLCRTEERNYMYKLLAIFALLLAGISGCGGGGGGGSDSGVNGSGNTFPNISSYVGTWVGVCSITGGSSQRYILTTTANNGQIVGNQITEYFGNTGCSGVALATETYSAPGTLTYVSTLPAQVVLSQNGMPSSIQVDQITSLLPQGFDTVTGSGVTKVINNGQSQWCFYYNSEGNCINDNGVQAAKTSSGAIYTQGNQLFELNLVNGVYTVGLLFTKQ